MKTLLIYFAALLKLRHNSSTVFKNTKTLQPLPPYWAIIPLRLEEATQNKGQKNMHR